MCDYSLCGLPTRLAVEGEELVVHRFYSGSVGLASPTDLRPAGRPLPRARRSFWERIKSLFENPWDSPFVMAVCVPPGAQLILKDVPGELQRRWNIEEEEDVFFIKTSADVNTYRDAIHFRSGREVLLQSLREGIRVQILSLGNSYADSDRNLAIPVR